MEDTDWRPSPCPICGKLRSAERNPKCTNASCMKIDMQNTTRRIKKPEPIEFYVLREWDGGDSHHKNGFILNNKALVDEWLKLTPQSDYHTIRGILVHRLEDIPTAQDALKRQQALDKLTEEEKKLLGLI